MNRNRSSLQSLLLALLALGMIASSAQAATVVLDSSGTNAIGILDLAFSGDVYDVTFVDDTPGSNAVYGTPPTLDFNLSSVVSAAILVVNAELNTSPATTVGPEFGLNKNEYTIAEEWNRSGNMAFDTQQGEFFPTASAWDVGSFDSGIPLDATNLIWAKFTLVPEPGTAVLLGLGLTGLAGFGRSRRQARV